MNGHSPCASCKLLRRRCAKDCPFAPYFPAEDPHKFSIVHKVFGASNISKMLQELPVDHRADAVSSLVYEANARVRDPVYGCVGAISYLQKQVSELQMQLALVQADIFCKQLHQQQHHHPTFIPTPDDHDHDQYQFEDHFDLDHHHEARSFLLHNMNLPETDEHFLNFTPSSGHVNYNIPDHQSFKKESSFEHDTWFYN